MDSQNGGSNIYNESGVIGVLSIPDEGINNESRLCSNPGLSDSEFYNNVKVLNAPRDYPRK